MAVIRQQQEPQDGYVEEEEYSPEDDQAMGEMLEDDQAGGEAAPAGEAELPPEDEAEPVEGEAQGEEELDEVGELRAQVKQLTGIVTMMTGGGASPGGLPGQPGVPPHPQPAPAQPSRPKVPRTPEEVLDGIDFENAYADPEAMKTAFDTAVRRVLTRVDDAQAQSTEAASSYYSEQQRANRFYEDNPALNTDQMRPVVADMYRRIESGYHQRGFVPTQDQILQETAEQVHGLFGERQEQGNGRQGRQQAPQGRRAPAGRQKPTLAGPRGGRRQTGGRARRKPVTHQDVQSDFMADLLT